MKKRLFALLLTLCLVVSLLPAQTVVAEGTNDWVITADSTDITVGQAVMLNLSGTITGGINWSVSDSTIAQINGANTEATLTGKGVGTVTVTAMSAEDNTIFKTIDINVSEGQQTTVTWRIVVLEGTGEVDTSMRFKVVTSDDQPITEDVTWSVGSPDVIGSIEKDPNDPTIAVATLKAEGTETVTAKGSSAEASIEVTVKAAQTPAPQMATVTILGNGSKFVLKQNGTDISNGLTDNINVSVPVGSTLAAEGITVEDWDRDTQFFVSWSANRVECGDDQAMLNYVIPAEGVSFEAGWVGAGSWSIFGLNSQESVGTTKTATVEYGGQYPTDPVTWSSSNASVATVDTTATGGSTTVNFLADGVVTISAAFGTDKFSFTVVVGNGDGGNTGDNDDNGGNHQEPNINIDGNEGTFTVTTPADTWDTDGSGFIVAAGQSLNDIQVTVSDPVFWNADRGFNGWLPCIQEQVTNENGDTWWESVPIPGASPITTAEMLAYPARTDGKTLNFVAQWGGDDDDYYNEILLNTLNGKFEFGNENWNEMFDSYQDSFRLNGKTFGENMESWILTDPVHDQYTFRGWLEYKMESGELVSETIYTTAQISAKTVPDYDVMFVAKWDEIDLEDYKTMFQGGGPGGPGGPSGPVIPDGVTPVQMELDKVYAQAAGEDAYYTYTVPADGFYSVKTDAPENFVEVKSNAPNTNGYPEDVLSKEYAFAMWLSKDQIVELHVASGEDANIWLEEVTPITKLEVVKQDTTPIYPNGVYIMPFHTLKDVTLKVTFADNTTATVEGSEVMETFAICTFPIDIAIDDETGEITLWCCGEEANYTINLEQKKVVKIEADFTPPFDFYENDYGWMNDMAGCFIYDAEMLAVWEADYTLTFDDGSTEVFNLPAEGQAQYRSVNLDIMNPQMRGNYWSVGTNTIELDYGGLSTTVDVEIKPNPVDSIELLDLGKKEYVLGDPAFFEQTEEGWCMTDADFSEFDLKVNYKDGTSKVLTEADLSVYNGIVDNIDLLNGAPMLSDFDMQPHTGAGKNLVAIGYMGYVGMFEVDIIEPKEDPKPEEVKSIAFEKATYEIFPGYSFQPMLMITPEGLDVGKVTYTSSDAAIANITEDYSGNSLVAGNKPGTVTITATTASGLTATCKVVVKPIPELKAGSAETLKLAAGEVQYYTFKTPADGTYELYTNQKNQMIVLLSDPNQLMIDGETIEAQNKYGQAFELKADTTYTVHIVNIADTAIDDKVYLTMDSHTCKLTKVPAKEATYTEDGNIEYYACAACDKKYSDAEGKKVITGSVILPQLIEVVGDKAEVSTGAVDKAIEEAATSGDKKDVVLDLTHEEVVGEVTAPVTKTEIPVESIEKVADANASLTLTKEDATVSLDKKALAAVAAQAGTAEAITLVVEEVKTEELTAKQQEAVEKVAKNKTVAKIISAELLVQTAEGQKNICTEADKGFGGGTVTVKIPFTPEPGFKGSDYVVIYVADDGSVERINTKYKDGCLVVDLKHFSDYVIVNDAKQTGGNEGGTGSGESQPTEPTTPEATKPAAKPGKPAPATGDNANLLGMTVLMVMSGLLAAVFLALRKRSRA